VIYVIPLTPKAINSVHFQYLIFQAEVPSINFCHGKLQSKFNSAATFMIPIRIWFPGNVNILSMRVHLPYHKLFILNKV